MTDAIKQRLIQAGLFLLFLAIGDQVLGLFGFERFQTWLELHPRGFMMNQAGGTGWQEFQGREIEYSFNADRTRVSGKEASKTVLLLGDSFAFGLYLTDRETIAWKMNQILPSDWAVKNAAVGGTGTADHAALLETFGPEWNPDIVLLLLNSDDVDRTLAKNLFVLEHETLLPSQRWEVSGLQRTFTSIPGHRWFQRNSYFYSGVEKLMWNKLYFVDLWKQQDRKPVIRPPDSAFASTSVYPQMLEQAMLLRMKNASRALGADFFVAYTGFAHPDSASFYTKPFLKVADSFFESNGIPWLNLTDSLRKPGSPPVKKLTLFPDNHPNAAGTDRLAVFLGNWLQENIAQSHNIPR